MIWDTEVDVLCVGAGVGALATAVAAADADAEVIVVTAGADLSDPLRPDQPSWPPVADDNTNEYLASLIEGFTAAESPAGEVPIRRTLSQPARTRAVETFSGARVIDWGSECLGAATASLFSTVRGWTVTTMADADGRSVLVAPVDVGVGPADCTVHGLHRALVSAVEDRGVEVMSRSPLLRLVFDGGAVVGAVVGVPGRELAVGARHGVVLAPDLVPGSTDAVPPAHTADYRMALVSIPGSRFARVELLGTPAPAAQGTDAQD